MKKNKIKNIKRIINHNGVFHCDDIFTVALMQLINNNIIIDRVAETTHKNTTATLVADIGGGYFDHHNNKNTGERCSCKIIWEEYKTQIINLLKIKKEGITSFEKFLEEINLQDLTGRCNLPELGEAFRSLNQTFLEKESNFSLAVNKMKLIIKLILRGASEEVILNKLINIINLRASAQKRAINIAEKYLQMPNKKDMEVWVLPVWLPYIKLYFNRNIAVPDKIIIKNERGYSVQSWNYSTINWDRITPKHVHKDTCIFVKNIHDAHLCTCKKDDWF